MLDPSRNGTNSPFTAGVQSNPRARQVQLLHHQRMQQSRQIGAGRHPHPGASGNGSSMVHAPPTRSRLSSTSTRLPRPRQVGRARQPIVARAHDNHVPGLRRQFPHRCRQSNLPQNRGCRRRAQIESSPGFPASIYTQASTRKQIAQILAAALNSQPHLDTSPARCGLYCRFVQRMFPEEL